MIKSKFNLFFIIVAVAVAGYFLYQLYQSPTKKYVGQYDGQFEKITVGVEKSLLPSLVWIAENKGYFQENGVEVTIKEYDSGRAAFTAMLGGENLDMVTVAQTPVMFNSFKRNDFAIVSAMVSSYNDVFVLARRDHGITKPEDLRGKKIGVTKGSTGQYFLGIFLDKNNLQLSEVEEVDLPAGQLAQNVIDGTVDAISVWQPHIYNAQKALGGKSIIFPTEKIFREDFYFVAYKQFLQNRQEATVRFLKAIKQAEEFIAAGGEQNNSRKNEVFDFISKRLGIDRVFTALVWNNFTFGLSLDPTIIQTLEQEAAWAIKNKLTTETAIPNYRDYISVDALKKVAPEKMSIE